MTHRLSLHLAGLVALLAGCQAPVSLPPPPTATVGGASRPAPYRLQAPAEPLGVIVRWREGAGRLDRARTRARAYRAMRLARTEVLTAASLSEREALLAALREDPAVAWAEPDVRLQMSGTPNDPGYPQQWALPRIQAPAAWDLTRGAGVRVAVLDTGVDTTHPDLAGQIEAGPDLVDRDDQPQDEQGHGTHVAGTIAALLGNGVGVAGLAPGSKVLAIRVLDAQGSGSLSDIADGVLAAVERGARVINLSLGGESGGTALQEAVAEATAKGVLVVAAAGNDGSTRRSYPAAYPGVLAVGASTATDTRAGFSNHGSWVTIAAPGDKILSTKLGGGTTTMSGTSMAAPHVAAAAALVWASQPKLTSARVQAVLQASGATVRGFEANPALRRLDVLAALRLASGSPAPAPSPVPSPSPSVPPAPKPRPTPVVPPSAGPAPPWAELQVRDVAARSGLTRTRITWRTSAPADGAVLYGPTAELGDAATRRVPPGTTHAVLLTALRPASTYYFKVRSRDAGGRLAESPVQAFRTRP